MNRSKFIQLTSTILLEYIINDTDISNDTVDNNIFHINDRNPILFDTLYKNNPNNTLKLYSELTNDNLTNNNIFKTVLSINSDNSIWFYPNATNINDYLKSLSEQCNSTYKIINDSVSLDSTSRIRYDSIRLHILSGYSFGDVFGFMLQISTLDKNRNNIKLCNLLHKRSDGGYIFEKPLIIDNKIYDKYLEIKIPSSRDMRNIENPSDYMNAIAGDEGLNLIDSKISENIKIIYSDILKNTLEAVYDNNLNIIGNTFKLENFITIELPYETETDKFNVFMEESNLGNYINFYCTWDNEPITLSTVSAFNTRIKLYSANGNQTNENILNNLYEADNEQSLNQRNKWIIYHEIVTSCYNENGQLIELPQTYSIQQSFDTSSINMPSMFKYMPILDTQSSSTISYITFEYTARLLNKYDGTQIVRKGALTSFNTNRYISNLNTISSSNITTYNVFNKINRINNTINNITNQPNKKYIIKEYINCNDILVNSTSNDNIIQLNQYGGNYKIKLNKLNSDGTTKPLNLLNTSSYVLIYKDVNNKINEIPCSYSENMNLVYGELEFNINLSNINKMIESPNKSFAIKCKNIDGSSSIITEINYIFNTNK